MAEQGERIGGYRLLEHLGQGAFGVVWRAVCEEDGKAAPRGSEAAIKVLHRHLAFGPDGERVVQRFRREARLATKLTHPHVVRVLEFGEDAGQNFLVMELAKGRSLSDYLRDNGIAPVSIKSSVITLDNAGNPSAAAPPPVRGLPPGEMIEILRQTAGVLQAACDIGLLHRDIKPDNLFVDKRVGKDGIERIDVKVLDFGLAKDLLAQSLSLTSMGSSVGTPAYMSPEQFDAAAFGEPDIRADLYSLGALAYHALTGRAPFPGPTPSAFMMQHQHDVPESACKINPEVPKGLSEVIDRLLAKLPADRHQTPAELIEDLNRVERGQPPLVRYKPRRPGKQRRWLVPVLAAALVAVIAGASGLWWLNNAGREARAALAAAEAAAGKSDWDSAMTDAQRGLAVPDVGDDVAERLRAVVARAEEAIAAKNRAEEEARLAKRSAAVAAADRRLAEGEAAFTDGRLAEAETHLSAAAATYAELGEQTKQAGAEALQRRVTDAREKQAAAEERERRERERFQAYANARDAAREVVAENNPDRLEAALDRATEAGRLASGDAERKEADELLAGIREAMARRKDVAAVLEFEVGDDVPEVSGRAIAVRLEQALGGQYRLVNRSLVSKALEELQFQQTDLFERSNASRFADFVKARYAVTGHVVRLGDELTVAAQVVDLRTAAIHRRAEVTAGSAGELNALFRELATQLEMDEAAQRAHVRERRDFPRWLRDGEEKLASARQDEATAAQAGRRAEALERSTPKGDYVTAYAEAESLWRRAEADYAAAVSSLRRATTVKSDAGAQAMLEQAEGRWKNLPVARARAAAAHADARARYDAYASAIAEGDRKLAEEEWDEAATAYRTALAIQGYADDPGALQGVGRAGEGKARRIYRQAMREGDAGLAAEKWPEAETAFLRALAADGYADDAKAKVGLEEARGGAALKTFRKEMDEGRAKLAAEDWSSAEAAFRRALSVEKYANDPDAREGLAKARGGSSLKTFAAAVAEGEYSLQAEDWSAAEAAFRRALAIPGRSDDKAAREGLERALGGVVLKEYRSAMELGAERFAADDWKGAEDAYAAALRVPGRARDAEALAGLERARTGASLKAYTLTMTLGNQCLEAEDWSGAEAAFAAALLVPGFTEDARARQSLEEARGGASHKVFRMAMALADENLEKENWAEAEAAYAAALRVPGFENNDRAKEGLFSAKGGAGLKLYRIAMALGDEKLANEEWKEAEAAYAAALRAPGFESDAEARLALESARGGAALKTYRLAMQQGNAMVAAKDWNGAEAAFSAALQVEGFTKDREAIQGIAMAIRGQEEEDYAVASRTNSIEGWKRFLVRHGSGKRAADAKTSLLALNKHVVLVVDKNGGGQAQSVGEALFMAESGNTIRIRSGRYDERLAITKLVTLEGEGEVILRPAETRESILTVNLDAAVTIRNLVFEDSSGRGAASGVSIRRGKVTMEGCRFSLPGSEHAITIKGAKPQLMLNDCEISSSPLLVDGANLFARKTRFRGRGVTGAGGSIVELRECEFTDLTFNCVGVNDTTRLTMVSCTVRNGGGEGILYVGNNASAKISSCEFVYCGTITAVDQARLEMDNCSIRGTNTSRKWGVHLKGSSVGVLTSLEISNMIMGVALHDNARGTLRNSRITGSGENGLLAENSSRLNVENCAVLNCGFSSPHSNTIFPAVDASNDATIHMNGGRVEGAPAKAFCSHGSGSITLAGVTTRNNGNESCTIDNGRVSYR